MKKIVLCVLLAIASNTFAQKNPVQIYPAKDSSDVSSITVHYSDGRSMEFMPKNVGTTCVPQVSGKNSAMESDLVTMIPNYQEIEKLVKQGATFITDTGKTTSLFRKMSSEKGDTVGFSGEADPIKIFMNGSTLRLTPAGTLSISSTEENAQTKLTQTRDFLAKLVRANKNQRITMSDN